MKLVAALFAFSTEINRFIGADAGTVPIPEFFAPENIERIMKETACTSIPATSATASAAIS